MFGSRLAITLGKLVLTFERSCVWSSLPSWASMSPLLSLYFDWISLFGLFQIERIAMLLRQSGQPFARFGENLNSPDLDLVQLRRGFHDDRSVYYQGRCRYLIGYCSGSVERNHLQ